MENQLTSYLENQPLLAVSLGAPTALVVAAPHDKITTSCNFRTENKSTMRSKVRIGEERYADLYSTGPEEIKVVETRPM